MRKTTASATGTLVFLFLFIPALANDIATEDPYLQPDESWMSLSGTAVDVKNDRFTLDYGEGTVLVEMDDWDWYGDTGAMIEGDEVTVYGEVDDDLYELTSIEASSVYVEDMGTYYYAKAADEETDEVYDYWFVAEPVEVGQMVIRGTVTAIDGREFTLDTGKRALTVDTIMMDYNPLDEKGFQDIDKGDYVSASGEIDIDVWEDRELTADSVVTLIEE